MLSLPICTFEQTDTLTTTKCNKKGFGSTDKDILPPESLNELATLAAVAAKINNTTEYDIDKNYTSYNVICPPDPFLNTETIHLS